MVSEMVKSLTRHPRAGGDPSSLNDIGLDYRKAVIGPLEFIPYLMRGGNGKLFVVLNFDL